MLRAQAVEHRGDAQAAQCAAVAQETHAAELADTGRRNQIAAEQEGSAATVKREVADDLNTQQTVSTHTCRSYRTELCRLKLAPLTLTSGL